MDTSECQMDDEVKEIHAGGCGGRTPPRRPAPREARCAQPSCHRRLTTKDTHHANGERVCNSCDKLLRKRERSPEPAASSSSSRRRVSEALSAPVTRSTLPALPTSWSYLTHEWEIYRATDESHRIAAEWVRISSDPRADAFPRRFIQGSPQHQQWSVLSAQHNWREVQKLANQTERVVRDVGANMLPNKGLALSKLHLVAFKVLRSEEGYGGQLYHYDCEDLDRAKQCISVAMYASKTISTDFPRHTAATMRPVFIRGERATESEAAVSRRLLQPENFMHLDVDVGDFAYFSGLVVHRGIGNPNPEPRWVIYMLFSPTMEKHQDLQQRVPDQLPLHAPLTDERRWAIINYHKLGMKVEAIALQVGCSQRTVYHWLNHYRENGTVTDEPRSGRPASALLAAVAEARAHPFTSTPRMLKATLRLTVSKRTIRRRLNDDGLFGRVSRHFFKLSEETIRARLSFANGYKDWSEQRWMSVLFSDEKIFTLGLHGRVWVQRPPNSEWQPQYCRELESHPAGVNFWGCFSARGVGGCETFTYRNTGEVMRGIVNYHLIPSAEKLFRRRPPEQWWLLWDNSPIHKAGEVQDALHRKGVDCLELSPYSPDLNPMEHVLADLARRVEQRFPSTVDELEEAIHAEWLLTNVDFLTRLAHSMPRRIEAVLNNQGHATKY